MHSFGTPPEWPGEGALTSLVRKLDNRSLTLAIGTNPVRLGVLLSSTSAMIRREVRVVILVHFHLHRTTPGDHQSMGEWQQDRHIDLDD